MNHKEELLNYHYKHAWQPFTQMKLSGDPVIIEKGEAEFLFTESGSKIIDAIGSWWVSVHGHSHPVLTEALSRQVKQLDHVIYSYLSHESALRLSAELCALTDHRLPRVFYSDNGSTAVEIALKMAYQYFQNTGRPEKRGFFSLEGGYHGDTIGTMSVGARSVFHEMFSPLFFNVTYLKAPYCPFKVLTNQEEEKIHIQQALEDLEMKFRTMGEETAAVIIEPVLQGASAGMMIYPVQYLRRLRELCNEYDVFLIADEVFTGFGRTGTFFAVQQADIYPDIMALSKGISGGVIPFAATLASERIYEGFLSDDRGRTLFHGHSMTGNPAGCSLALAGLELFKAENRLEQVNRIAAWHIGQLDSLHRSDIKEFIKEIRFIGSVSAIELNPSVAGNYTGAFGWDFMKKALQKGVLLRPLGNVIYTAPPFVISEESLKKVYEIIYETIKEMLRGK